MPVKWTHSLFSTFEIHFKTGVLSAFEPETVHVRSATKILVTPWCSRTVWQIVFIALFQLNQLQILSPEMDADVDAAELGPERQQLTTALLTLRLLGKFLGFLSFLPFRAQEKLPEVLQRDHVASRNAVSAGLLLSYTGVAPKYG